MSENGLDWLKLSKGRRRRGERIGGWVAWRMRRMMSKRADGRVVGMVGLAVVGAAKRSGLWCGSGRQARQYIVPASRFLATLAGMGYGSDGP